MKETDFIKQNQETWREIENAVGKKSVRQGNANLGDSFVRLSEDLSYAQTYYPRRTVRVYLNGLTQRMYKILFNTRIRDRKNQFWSHELPTAMWESRVELGVTFLAFLLACFIGVVSSKYDDGFAAQILGDGYVNMTRENIAKGDPMGVYKDSDGIEMFFMIVYNNLQVSVITFVLGILFGVGTLGIIFKNGIMLGVFQYFFVQYGLGFTSFLTIWQHGVIEIASIVVAGGAGLVLGRSIVFPGSLPRSVSLKFGFLKGVKIMLGVAPLIVLAAILESFYTRFDDLPVAIRLFTILLSLAFIIGYYIVLPIKRGKQQSLLGNVAPDYSHSVPDFKIAHNKLRTVGESVSDALLIIQQNLGAFMRINIWPALLFAIVVVAFLREEFAQYLYFSPFSGQILEQLFMSLGEVAQRAEMLLFFVNFEDYLLMLPVTTLLLTWILVRTTKMYVSLLGTATAKPNLKKSAALGFAIALALLPFFVGNWYFIVFGGLVLPALACGWFVAITQNKTLFSGVVAALGLLLKGVVRHVPVVVLAAFFSILVAMLVQSPVLLVTFELANGFIGFTENKAMYAIEVVIIGVSVLTFFCAISFLVLAVLLNYRSLHELENAEILLAEIAEVKINKSKHGSR